MVIGSLKVTNAEITGGKMMHFYSVLYQIMSQITLWRCGTY